MRAVSTGSVTNTSPTCDLLVDLLFSQRLKACALCSISGSVCPIDAKLCSRPPAALLLTWARSSATIRPTVNCRSELEAAFWILLPAVVYLSMCCCGGGLSSGVKGERSKVTLLPAFPGMLKPF